MNPQRERGGGANLDADTVRGFGAEWSAYDQVDLPQAELEALFAGYFRLFPWNELAPGAVGADIGCGSGRWAALAAPRVGRLICIDASAQALAVARRRLGGLNNCELHCASVDAMPIPDGTLDFAYSLGVLHHVPDTAAALRACAAKLRPGAPMLVYLYYAFDNRPAWFRRLWQASDLLRRGISRLPFGLRLNLTRVIAALVYFPLARAARVGERAGLDVGAWPLSAYREASFYTMRTDALDRFGTRLEQRFSRAQIRDLLRQAGLESIAFNPDPPYWCALGRRRAD
ncbi:MAG: class I SAM-dependent methyltransferase [Gammaproteobacteria bacterium]